MNKKTDENKEISNDDALQFCLDYIWTHRKEVNASKGGFMVLTEDPAREDMVFTIECYINREKNTDNNGTENQNTEKGQGEENGDE